MAAFFMSKLTQSIFSLIQQFPDLPIIIAYSGGVDSQVVLNIVADLKHTKQINNSILACHVNHGLSENAESWSEFANAQCRQRNIKLQVKRVLINLDSSDSVEALARSARYQALVDSSVKPSLILTGHHSDDQAETFLLALKRGSGVKGLSAMKAISSIGHHKLARPLLDISRKDIVDYANSQKLTWIEDESNTDIRFDRNFIRNCILPELTQRWPSITQTINRSAAHCRQSQELLDDLAKLDLALCQDSANEFALSIEQLLRLSEPRLKNLLRYFLALHKCLMPTTKQLEQVMQQMLSPVDQMPAVNLDNKMIRRFNGKLYLTRKFENIDKFTVEIVLRNTETRPEIVELPDGLGKLLFLPEHTNLNNVACVQEQMLVKEHLVGLPSTVKKISLCFSHDNPSVLPQYRQHHRPLKKVLQELKIAPWERKRTPLLFVEHELALITGYCVCKPFLPNSEVNIIRVCWLIPQ